AAGHRSVDDQLDQPARLPCRAGRDARLLGDGGARLPVHRRRPRPPRPAGEVRIVAVAAEVVAEAQLIEHRRGFRRRWYRTPSFVAGPSVLALIGLAALAAPLLTQHAPTGQDLLHPLEAPASATALGTVDP